MKTVFVILAVAIVCNAQVPSPSQTGASAEQQQVAIKPSVQISPIARPVSNILQGQSGQPGDSKGQGADPLQNPPSSNASAAQGGPAQSPPQLPPIPPKPDAQNPLPPLPPPKQPGSQNPLPPLPGVPGSQPQKPSGASQEGPPAPADAQQAPPQAGLVRHDLKAASGLDGKVNIPKSDNQSQNASAAQPPASGEKPDQGSAGKPAASPSNGQPPLDKPPQAQSAPQVPNIGLPAPAPQQSAGQPSPQQPKVQPGEQPPQPGLPGQAAGLPGIAPAKPQDPSAAVPNVPTDAGASNNNILKVG